MILKFRAWQIENCEICEVTTIDYNGERFGFGRQLDDEHFNEPDYWLRMDECILIQSTGMHDKNGVEIFADDIVVSSRGVGVVETKIGHAPQVTYKNGNDLLRFVFENLSVIGNSYENPELLEQKNG